MQELSIFLTRGWKHRKSGNRRLNSANDDAVEIARLHHTALPPLATLDEDGLLSHLYTPIRAIEIDSGAVAAITGTSQPLEPNNQGTMAREILQLPKQHNIEQLIVLAGMVDEAARKEILLSDSSSYRIDLESRGAHVRADEPARERLESSDLLSSLGPVYGINSAYLIASTVGASGDITASQKLLLALDQWFGFNLIIPEDANQKLVDKLKQISPNKTEDLVSRN